jgi:Arc/MetJ-type ribon-helix-helix transcriptional regulator
MMGYPGGPTMKTYQIALPDEVAAFVDRMLAEKQWETVDDLVVYGLLRVQDELRQDETTDLDALRKAIQVGIDQADRGEVAELDMNVIWERAMQRLKEREELAHATDNTDGAG